MISDAYIVGTAAAVLLFKSVFDRHQDESIRENLIISVIVFVLFVALYGATRYWLHV